MFGYVRANLADLSEEEQKRYRAHYCGLCRSLGQRHGLAGRMTLSFDMTFLSIFLSSLYEPEEKQGEARCVPHPAKPHAYVCSEISDYAADMTVALTYHKCLDDWQDDKNVAARACAQLLKRRYAAVQEKWPRQTGVIEKRLEELARLEKRREASPDAAANCFGQLMAEMFVMHEDYWRGAVRSFGMALGRFVYIADAACDYDRDVKSGSYNPVALMGRQPEEMREDLKQMLGSAAEAFEALPLISDAHIMRNILYSGIWQTYNETMEKRRRDREEKGKGGANA